MTTRTLEEVLAGTSEHLFPAELGAKAVTLQSRASDGDTPLHILAWQNDVEGAQILISAEADVNAPGDMGYTPLHVAVGQNNIALAKILINAGAHSDAKSEIGGTAREEALKKGGEWATLFDGRPV